MGAPTIRDYRRGQLGNSPLASSVFAEFMPGPGKDPGGVYLDTNRLTIHYCRESDTSGVLHPSGYLAAQKKLRQPLIDAGLAEDQILTLIGDTGTSAALGRLFRADLDLAFKLMGQRRVGNVVIIDVARLFRDMSMVEPTEFAATAQWATGVRVLIYLGEKWQLLNMDDEHDARRFLDMAQAAADERRLTRKRTHIGRLDSVADGGWSGSDTPVGWRGVPSPGEGQNATLVPCPEHFERLFDLWEIALQPDLVSWGGLHRYVVGSGFKFPPFGELYRAEAFARSCINKCVVQDGQRRRCIRPDEFWIPSEDMLRNMLLNWLALGHLFFGSGKAGGQKKNRMQRRLDKVKIKLDSWINENRDYVDQFDHLRICGPGSREETLLWKVLDKWSPDDPRVLEASKFETRIPNPHRIAGLANQGRQIIVEDRNPYKERVFCIDHGVDQTGVPALTHHLAHNSAQEQWICNRDYVTGVAKTACALWGGGTLTRIIDTHLQRGIRDALSNHNGLLESLTDEVQRRKAALATLRSEYVRTGEVLAKRRKRHDHYIDMCPPENRRELDRLKEEYQREILPLIAAVQRLADRIEVEEEQLAAEGIDAAGQAVEQVEKDLRRVLQRAVDSWPSLSVGERLTLFRQFVTWIGVKIGDGKTSSESLILFTWKTGVTDTLVSWRGPWQDRRPMTREEEEAIRVLWHEDSDWSAFKALLLPGRKYYWLRHRALGELHLGRGFASVPPACPQWVHDAIDDSRCWGEKHIDVLYLHVSRKDQLLCVPVQTTGDAGLPISLPTQVADGLDALLVPKGVDGMVSWEAWDSLWYRT